MTPIETIETSTPVSATAGATRPRPKTWRALLEEGVLLTASTLDYWAAYGNFTVDWQFTWKTFGRKFFTSESPRFDSNAFWFNWSHAGAGAGYYSMARANGVDSRIATLFSLGTSALWETISEWREIISLNDMISSTFGGPAIAEPIFQVGSYFSRRPGLLNRVAELLTDPFLAVNNWFDRGEGLGRNSGPAPGWHRFVLRAGLREDKVSPAATTAVALAGANFRQFAFGVDMETVTAPGSGEAGDWHRFLADTLSSRLRVEAAWSGNGIEEVVIRTESVLFGWGRQSIGTDAGGAPRGSGFSLGYGVAFDLYKKRPVAWYDGNVETESGLAAMGNARFERPVPARFTDKLAVLSPAGAVFRLDTFGRNLHVRGTAAAYADFAMVNALAYNRWTESHDPGGVKTTLLNWGYYYAAGVTLESEALVEWGSWFGRGEARLEGFRSIQGLDRYQYLGLVTEDFVLHDTRVEWRLELGYRLARAPVELGLTAEGIRRRGRILDLHERYGENRLSFEARLVF